MPKADNLVLSYLLLIKVNRMIFDKKSNRWHISDIYHRDWCLTAGRNVLRFDRFFLYRLSREKSLIICALCLYVFRRLFSSVSLLFSLFSLSLCHCLLHSAFSLYQCFSTGSVSRKQIFLLFDFMLSENTGKNFVWLLSDRKIRHFGDGGREFSFST